MFNKGFKKNSFNISYDNIANNYEGELNCDCQNNEKKNSSIILFNKQICSSI